MTQSRLRHKGAIAALLAAMLVIHNVHRTAVVPLLDDLRVHFATDYRGAGTLFAAYVLGYAMFQVVVGFVGDRFNARHLLIGGLLLSMALSALFAWTRSYQLALLARMLLGATGALLYTPAMKLGITLFERGERGRVLGVLQAGAGLGIVGALIAVPLGARQFGLTGGFLTLSLFTAAVVLPAVGLLPDAPGQPPAARVVASLPLGGRADFWQLLLVSFTGMLAGYGLLTWLPTYLTRTFGYSAVQAGSLASLSNVALLVGAPVVGMLADLPRGRTGVLLGGSALALVGFLALIPSQPAITVLVTSILMGVSLAATTAPLMLFAGERFGPDETARAIGLLATAAQLGATLAGVVYGAILAYQDSFQLMWIACALLAFLRLGILLNLMVQDRRVGPPRHRVEPGV
jgi:MFS family permease